MKDDQGPPTVRRISELSGLAVPAVSRALHDAPDISQDTRDLVQDIARQIGYILPGRRRSKPPKSGVISLVMSSNHDLLHTRALLISAMSLALRATPYHFVVTPYVDGDDPLTPVRHLVETASVDAIILNQTEYRDTRIRYLMERGFPFATHGRSMWSKRHAYFDFDNEAFAHRCIEWLADRGRRNVLMIAPPMQHQYAQYMAAGAKSGARTRGINLSVLDRVTSDSASDVVREAILGALCECPETDGIICGSSLAAMGSLAALDATGRTLGEDVDVCMKEASPFFAAFQNLFVVKEDITRAGSVLARAATQAIAQPELPPLQVLDAPRPEDRL